MKKKKKHDDEHVDEAWLLPYSDMLTLLLALFIVMFAMSEADKEKIQQMSQSFSTVFTGGSGIMQHEGDKPVPAQDPNLTEKQKGVVEQDTMVAIKKGLEEGAEKGGYGDKVHLDIDSEGLHISIQDTLLFNSGDAEVQEEFSPILTQISSMISTLDNDIRIAGHTDNVPIKNSKYNSNWDLSYYRSLNVKNFMEQRANITPKKFSLEVFSEYKPKYDNSTPEGRAKNRRVEILIVRKHEISENLIK